ncbi:MAG: MMPL family transporter, partial [Polyangiaceae bacterium]
GINYPIVLLSRYQEFRARGMEAAEARRSAVANAFRAELVGAFVAAIAYGSLSLTQFRGFSQFGVIGFVGMLSVWIAIVPLVPATLVLLERAQLPRVLRDRAPPVTRQGARPLASVFATLVTKHPWPFVIAGLALTIAAAMRIPAYARDPW